MRRPGSPATIRNGSIPHLARVFGEERAAEGAALAAARRSICASTRSRPTARRPPPRSPISIRCRRAGRRVGLRIALDADAKNPAVHAEPAFIKGLVEVQDEGSQLAALLAGAKPGEQVVDLCAGAGGKTLALAAAMDNHGQIYATDTDKRRLAPIHARLERAGRAQRAGAHARIACEHRARRSRRPRRPRPDRRAVHRQRHLAAQSRRQVARAAGRARAARSRSRPRRSTARRAW